MHKESNRLSSILGEGFILKHERINLMSRTGFCDACGEEIDVTDGTRYVRMQLRTEGLQLSFHVICYEYIMIGMIRFNEVFIQNRTDDDTKVN